MVGQILLWYLVVQFFSLAGFPLTFAWLRRLPSRGYGAAKALGILLSGVLLWWGGTMHLWGNTASAAISIALVIFGAGIWLLRGQWSEVLAWWHKHRGFVLTAEALFSIVFVFWALVRAAQPQLETAGGEKWMEIGFLNAVLRSNQFPPLDPWLSGFAISYYYLGYVLLGMLTRVAGLPATIAFNLGNASWFALAAIGAYGIVYDLLQGRSTQKALLGPLMLLLTGNGEGFLEVLHARGLLSGRFWVWLDIRNLNQAPEPPFSWVPQRFFWWWQASRTLQDYAPWGARLEVIDEFPAFSFILGDMHPHVLALPFVLVVVALALNTYLEQLVLMPGDSSWSFKSFLANLRLPLIGTAVVLGALGFLNTWDFPIYWALWAGALVLGRYRN
ncbi:MAG: hypothetical protein JW981_06845, partial [Anaerolineae bacterium]|nr:hypothetical protein [Anaerolineae bacterium]